MLDHSIHSREIAEFDSSGVSMQFLLARISPIPDSFNIARMTGGGRIGRHKATSWQVFVVLEGLVDVADAEGESYILGPGEGVQWEPGESHESVAIVDSIIAIIEASEQLPSNG